MQVGQQLLINCFRSIVPNIVRMNDKTNRDFPIELVFDFQSTLRQEIEKDIILDRPYGQLDIPNTVRHHRAVAAALRMHPSLPATTR